MKRFIIYDKEWGIYLGHCIGMGFWSLLDPVGQEYAVCFDSIEEAQKHVSSWEENNDINKYTYPEIDSEEDLYVSMDNCIKVGLPKWEINR